MFWSELKMFIVLLASVFLIHFGSDVSYGALVPKAYLDSVVAIGVKNNEQQTSWQGTGFFYGKFLHKSNKGTDLFRIFLVTNKHVLKGNLNQ